jgi:hypothetical protein
MRKRVGPHANPALLASSHKRLVGPRANLALPASFKTN